MENKKDYKKDFKNALGKIVRNVMKYLVEKLF